MDPSPTLELRGISKSFGSVRALDNVDFAAYDGEIHAIVGDNGAGKSTMLKVVTGIYLADSGDVLVNGQPLSLRHDVAEVLDRGIAAVYQDLALVECLDIATNLCLGALPRRWWILLDRRRMEEEAAKVFEDLKVRIGDVRMPVGLLSGGQRQIIAIARAVRMDTSIILLDEPTAALGVRETGRVADILKELRQSGKTIILISHDLEFVFHHADLVTVLRLGQSVGTRRIVDVSREEVVSMITGAITRDGLHSGRSREVS